MNDIDKALRDLDSIRATMAASAVFQGLGPSVVAATGLLAAFTGLAQWIWPEALAANPTHFLTTWICVAIVAGGAIGLEMVARTRRIHGGAGHAMLVQAIEQFLPPAFAGAAIAAALYVYAPESLWLLPGLWSVLVSLGVFAAARTLPKAVNIVGAWYLVAGIGVIMASAETAQLTTWSMVVPFAVGQLLAGAVLALSAHEEGDGHEQ